jgi:hypothetical protein
MNVIDSVKAWLLEPENPSVRFYTLVDLLEQPADDVDVQEARQAIMTTGDVPRLLESQAEGGYWGKPEAFYHPAYTGAVWRFMLLAEFGADGSHPQIRKTAEHLFERSQTETGGFSVHDLTSPHRTERGSLCLTGNMVWSYVRLGYLDDLRVQNAIEWIVKYSRFDDGEATAWPDWLPQDPDDGCWGKHTCFRGVIAVLQALAEIPPERRSSQVQQTLVDGVEFLLIHHVYKHSHNLSKPISSYLQIGFPLFVDNDLLRMLLFLTKMKIHDARMQEAIDCLLHKKQSKLGHWKQQHEFPKNKLKPRLMPIPFTEKGQPSKWVTLRALTVLKRYGSNDNA